MEISLLIVDDHGILRAGLAALLKNERDIRVIGEADDGKSAVEMAMKMKPDIILMDLSLPEFDGIEATRRIVQKLPDTRILILSVHEESELIKESIKSGARGYILKDALKDDLIRAIHEVMRDEIYLDASMIKHFFQGGIDIGNEDPDPIRESLTPREIDVLQHLAKGYTNKETAKRLNISVRTVEYHRSHITSKLDIHSRAELTRYANQEDLI